jgi:hypothetical protein
VKRVEVVVAGLFVACWVLLFLDLAGWVHLAGSRDLGLYPYYSLAAALGSVSGHLFVWRLRRFALDQDRPARRRALLLHVAGPPGALALLRSFAPEPAQAAAPLVPVLGFFVFTVFFVVPLLMRRPGPRARGGTE